MAWPRWAGEVTPAPAAGTSQWRIVGGAFGGLFVGGVLGAAIGLPALGAYAEAAFGEVEGHPGLLEIRKIDDASYRTYAFALVVGFVVLPLAGGLLGVRIARGAEPPAP